EVMALDHALEPLALARAHDVHGVAGLEDLHRDLVAHLRLVAVLDAELAQHPHRRKVAARLLEVAGLGLRHLLDLAVLDEPDLDRLVELGLLLAVGVGVLLAALALHDHAGPGLDDGVGDRLPVLRVDLRHSDLASDDSVDGHRCSLARRSAPLPGSSLDVAPRRSDLVGYFACSFPNALISTSTPAGRSSFMSASTVC